jgi:hypothetical protein
MTGRRSRALVGLFGACVLAACRAEPFAPTPDSETSPVGAPPSAPTPEEAAAARRTLVRWLECEECVDGELAAVLRLGPLAVPTLVATLRGGPSPAVREKLHRELRIRYGELRDYARKHPAVRFDGGEDVWVDEQLANDIARYQVRSAEALAKLGGPEAKQALADALGDPLRPDVQTVVRKSLESVSGAR